VRKRHIKRYLVICTAFIGLFSSAPAQETSPKEKGSLLSPDLVELIKLDPAFKLDIRYATPNNFTGRPVYSEARAFLRRPVADALLKVHKKLKEKGYGLMIFDAYRPWSVTKLFWDRFPGFRGYLANPKKGSRHNRGCAVDLTIYDLKTAKEIEMPSPFDDFTERADPDYKGGTPAQRRARDLLRTVMESEGFKVFKNEWWHFDYKGWQEFPIMDLRFTEIPPMKTE